ncbi:MAG: DNA recombination protein RmuC [Burkholderiaceae bacterium]|nr:MAG: hypothetical protein CBC60_07075 [Betaproteobacteria bacterium TMED100]
MISEILLFSIGFSIVLAILFQLILFYKKIQIQTEKILALSEEVSSCKEKLNYKKDVELKNSKLEELIRLEKKKHEELKVQLALESNKNSIFLSAKQEFSDRFKTLANEILDEKTKAFANYNQEKLSQLLSPFQNDINKFGNKFEEIQKAASKERIELQSELKAEIGNMKEMSLAFKHQTKVQGNWGEIVLENILDKSGLRVGKDYKTQVSIKVETTRKVPDVIVYLPENKHLVIDSKVSMNAYNRFVNSDNESDKKKALKDHTDSIKARIKELGDKSYFDIPELNTPEMVFMFVPMESAFVAAIQADEMIFQTALDNKVLVATPTTLTTNLKIVKQLWRFEDQNKNSAELASRASKIHSKLRNFVKDIERVGLKISEAEISYSDAMNKLTEGHGNLINQAREFERLGVAVKEDFSENMIVKSQLGLKRDET